MGDATLFNKLLARLRELPLPDETGVDCTVVNSIVDDPTVGLKPEAAFGYA